MAQEEHLQLVSPQTNWNDFCHFTSDLGRIRDADVSNRYQYGELRLSRLLVVLGYRQALFRA